MQRRKLPNILVTGTPGTGKSTFVETLLSAEGFHGRMKGVTVGDLVKAHMLHDGFDAEWGAYTLNEDKLLDHMEGFMGSPEGGFVVEHHGSDFFPERWFDLVVVLRTRTDVLYDRLMGRAGYDKKKVEENVEAEIMQICLDEALEAYKRDIVMECQNNTVEEMNQVTMKVTAWVRANF